MTLSFEIPDMAQFFQIHPDNPQARLVRNAVDIIREVGPGGEYLTHEHTMKFFNQEAWDSRLGNRMNRERWEESGSMDIRAKAREEVKRILSADRPALLDAEVQKKIQRIVDEAEA